MSVGTLAAYGRVKVMDRVTQQNAVSVEESASASEEMNAQAEQMRNIVDELIALLGETGKTVPQDIKRDLRSDG